MWHRDPSQKGHRDPSPTCGTEGAQGPYSPTCDTEGASPTCDTEGASPTCDTEGAQGPYIVPHEVQKGHRDPSQKGHVQRP